MTSPRLVRTDGLSSPNSPFCQVKWIGVLRCFFSSRRHDAEAVGRGRGRAHCRKERTRTGWMFDLQAPRCTRGRLQPGAYAFSAINFTLSTTFTVSHKFWTRNRLQASLVDVCLKLRRTAPPLFFGIDKCSAGGLDLTEQTPVLLGSKAMATSFMDMAFGDPASPLVNRSRNSSAEDDDDDVVFIESIQPPSSSAPIIADQRNFIFAASRNEKLQGNYSIILPSSRGLASQKGSISETIVIDDEEDMETNGKEKTISSSFIEWALPGSKNRTKDLDFSTSSLSRSKTKTAVGPFNPGRMNVAGDVFQNGGFTAHHNPEVHLQNRLLLFLKGSQVNPSKNFVVRLCLPMKITRIFEKEF
ncbi:zinc finger MYM-type protein 5 isoform X4 [Orcinus orca]|uniref:zinc finger MYM-type protein 5 isoform X4 n=1 Tax=Orcinus orca TaxID=9733 RepID=UPI0014423F14|nr:zinc finger MYM-type protein 5 isoform X4 [Orcinus orca]